MNDDLHINTSANTFFSYSSKLNVKYWYIWINDTISFWTSKVFYYNFFVRLQSINMTVKRNSLMYNMNFIKHYYLVFNNISILYSEIINDATT